MLCICQINELPFVFFIPKPHQMNHFLFWFLGIETVKSNFTVGQYILGQTLFPLEHSRLYVCFSTYSKERIHHMYLIETMIIVICMVENIERARLISYYIHSLNIVYLSFSYMYKGSTWVSTSYNVWILIPLLCVRKLANGKVWHKSIAVELKAYTFPQVWICHLLFSFRHHYHIECKVLKDAMVSVLDWFCNVTPSDMFFNSKMIAFLLISTQRNNQITKTFTIVQSLYYKI